MFNSEREVIDFIEENDIKFIRLAFTDIAGMQRNVAILPAQLPQAIEKGVAFNARCIEGFCDVCDTELLLFPDLSTFALLPWRPSRGRVARFFCDIKRPDGSGFECDGRNILRDAEKQLKDAGCLCEIGAECEFYLFKEDEDGNSTKTPLDNGGYLCVAPDDRGENIRREICLTIEQMGLSPQSSHHEEGPGQNEIDFKSDSPLASADNVITFRSVVNTVADKNGLCACFMPKPMLREAGCGFHVILTLKSRSGEMSDAQAAKYFMAGLLEHINEMTVILNPDEQSFERIGNEGSPKYVSWTNLNFPQLIRLTSDEEKVRISLRSPDNTANPYLAYAVIIYAGLDGIKRKLSLQTPSDFDTAYASKEELQGLKKLPSSFKEAMEAARDGSFIEKFMNKNILDAIDARQKNLKL